MKLQRTLNYTLIAALTYIPSHHHATITINSSKTNMSYEQEIAAEIKQLSIEKHTTLISATWCEPCVELKKIMKEKGLAPNSIIYRETAGDKDILYALLQQNGITPPEGIPTIFKRHNGKISTYTGLSEGGTMPDETGKKTKIEEILEKD